MSKVSAIWKNGQVVLQQPATWPEGSQLRIEAVDDKPGLSEEEWANSPEAITDWIHWYDSLEPLQITPEDEADLAAWRRRIKEYTIEKSSDRIAGLFP